MLIHIKISVIDTLCEVFFVKGVPKIGQHAKCVRYNIFCTFKRIS